MPKRGGGIQRTPAFPEQMVNIARFPEITGRATENKAPAAVTYLGYEVFGKSATAVTKPNWQASQIPARKA